MLIAVTYAEFVTLAGTFGQPVFYSTIPTFKCVSSAGIFTIQHTTATKPGTFDEDFPSAYQASAIT